MAAPISMERSARRVDVDNRISLQRYHRIAHNLIRQADIYRGENNVIDLYVMLLRFSSLITETIPHHRDYKFSSQREKNYFKKKLLDALTELEHIKPNVQLQLAELNKKSRNQSRMWPQSNQQNVSVDAYVWPAVKKQITQNSDFTQLKRDVRGESFSHDLVAQNGAIAYKHRDSQNHRPVFMIPPKEETLQRHSILGPIGLHGQWKPPVMNQVIQYPSNLDLSPVDVPSLFNPDPVENKPVEQKPAETPPNRTILEEVLSLHDDRLSIPEISDPPRTFDVTEALSTMDIGREPCPPPVRAEVQDMLMSQTPESISVQTVELPEQLLRAQSPLEVHISASIMDIFMRIAKSNTDRNLETCGVLAGSLKYRKFYVTALIIPKQESTSDSCQTTNEEDVFEYQDKNSLFSLGWIHTHPTQSCFMSSIDIHTQYSYQVMLPEAIAIVMAPKDSSRKHGIFRLTVPGGMSVVKSCPLSGFHPHSSPQEGGPIYERCTDIYMNSDIKFEVADLR